MKEEIKCAMSDIQLARLFQGDDIRFEISPTEKVHEYVSRVVLISPFKGKFLTYEYHEKLLQRLAYYQESYDKLAIKHGELVKKIESIKNE